MLEHVDLHDYNTFGLRVRARFFCTVDSVSQLRDALEFSRRNDIRVLVLGGGSNVLLREDYPGMVLVMALQGIHVKEISEDLVSVCAASGENWHSFVEYCVKKGYYGLENLALIPGSVGAAPVQNIGAYGVEVKEFITQVTVLDTVSGLIHEMAASECGFGYRESVFKSFLSGTRIILSVCFKLHRQPRVRTDYAALAQALSASSPKPVPKPTPEDVFSAVCTLRRNRLPDPTVLGNAGSFFKNPVIPARQYAELLDRFPQMPGYVVDELDSTHPGIACVKIPAAWLIEQAGWKGRTRGGAGVYEKQPLVLVNRGGATSDDIAALARDIAHSIESTFGIRLEAEVQWIPPLAN